MTTIAFSTLELKGLWTRATGGSTADDPILDQCAEKAIEKVYRAEIGLNPVKRDHRKPVGSKRRGPDFKL